MSALASLPMYDWDELRGPTDRYWALIRDGLRTRGIDAPMDLNRGDPWAGWLNPALILSQTCGFPYRTALHGKVTLVGTPDFGLPDAKPGYYYSQLVVRADAQGDWTAFLDRTLAINDYDSQSGWAAPQNHAAPLNRRFDKILVTGAHVASAAAVADGLADIAAIDALTWRLIAAYRPEVAKRLRIVARTEATPGLPLITSQGRDRQAIAAAVADAIGALPAADRAALGLIGLAQIPAETYLAVPTPAGPCQAG